jgi:hypothetical protein
MTIIDVEHLPGAWNRIPEPTSTTRGVCMFSTSIVLSRGSTSSCCQAADNTTPSSLVAAMNLKAVRRTELQISLPRLEPINGGQLPAVACRKLTSVGQDQARPWCVARIDHEYGPKTGQERPELV